jgi:glyoxylase-like metal-dependent hydrolase (beta-lactamase superfamily II)
MKVSQTDGNFSLSDSVKSFKYNIVIPQSVYTIPDKYILYETVPPKPLTAKEIAKDIFLIESVSGDRNVVFVNMNDYIVVTEAPISSDITKSVIELIRKTLPGKPIKYVHLSHFHIDHTGGIRQFVSEGSTIIATPTMEAPLRSIIRGDVAVTKDDYSKNPVEPKFEFFTGMKVLQDKDHRIEFRQVANSHVEGLSFIYLPKEKIIYQGDLLTVPEDGTLTPAIATTREFSKYLEKNKIKWNRMIGHHSHAFITPQMFKTMLSMKK